MISSLDKAQDEYDNDLPVDDLLCLKCYKSFVDFYSDDYCTHCLEVIRERNRDKFIPEETY